LASQAALCTSAQGLVTSTGYIAGGNECKGAKASRNLGVHWRPCLEEKERLDAQNELGHAILTIDLKELEGALSTAKKHGVEAPMLKRGEDRVKVVKEMVKVRQELLVAVGGWSTAKLTASLEKAEDIGLDQHLPPATLEKAKKKLEFLRRRETASEDLKVAIAESDIKTLEEQLKVAKTMRLKRALLLEGEARVSELKLEITLAKNEYHKCMRGSDEFALHNAIKKVTELGVLSDPAEANARLEKLRAASIATQKLQEMIPKWKVTKLEEVLVIARQKEADPATIARAQARVQELNQIVAAARADLRKVSKGNDEKALGAAIKECVKVDCVEKAELKTAMARCNSLENREEARDALAEEMNNFNLLDLEEKLDTAIDLGCNKAILDKGKARVVELKAMMAKAKDALESAINGHDEVKIASAKAEAEKLNAADAALLGKAEERLAELKLKEVAKAELLTAMEGSSLKSLQKKYARAADLGVDAQTLKAAKKQEAAILKSMDEAKQELEKQITGKSSVHLVSALYEAQQLKAVDAETEKRAKQRLKELKKLDKAAQAVIEASQTENMGDMIRAMQTAKKLGVEKHVLDQGEAGMTVLRNLMHNAKVQLNALVAHGRDKEAIEVALVEAKRLNAVSKQHVQVAEAKIVELR